MSGGDAGEIAGVELVTTGAELLSGRTVNRHAQTVGDALFPLGLRLLRDTTVPDDLEAIEDAIRGALKRCSLVLVSGGLGPTSDDLTRDAVARITGDELMIDPDSLQRIRERYARSGRALNPNVDRHALVLRRAVVLPNAAGLAPGERIEHGGRVLFLLPGPPREFVSILNDHVLPWLRLHRASHPPATRIFQVCGVGESDIVTRIEAQGFPPPGVDVAYCAQPGRVEIRLAAGVGSEDALALAVEQVRRGLGEHIFAEERVDLAAVVGRLLAERRADLATAESCTGGLIGHRLTNIAGSSAWYRGGVVAYANESKARDLGVDPALIDRCGAVSEDVACAMASGVCARFGSAYGLAVTGIAGPTGGTEDKPVGTVWIAVATPGGVTAQRFRFSGTREINKDWAAQMALDQLRRRMG